MTESKTVDYITYVLKQRPNTKLAYKNTLRAKAAQRNEKSKLFDQAVDEILDQPLKLDILYQQFEDEEWLRSYLNITAMVLQRAEEKQNSIFQYFIDFAFP